MSSNVAPASSVQRSPDETNTSTKEETPLHQKEARLREKFFSTKLSSEETVDGQDSGEKDGEAAPPLNDGMKEKSVPREEAPKGGILLQSASQVESQKKRRQREEGIPMNRSMLGPSSVDTLASPPSIDESQEPRTTTIDVKRSMQIKMEEQQQRKKQKQQEVISKQLAPAGSVSKEKKKEAQATPVVSEFNALREKLLASKLNKNNHTSNPSPPSPSENTTTADNAQTVVPPSAVSIQSSENLTSTPPEGSATTSGRKQSRDKKDDDDDSRSSIKRRKEAKAREDDGTGGSKNHRDVDYRTRASSSAGDSSRIEPVIIEDCAENRGEQVIHGELAGQSTLEKVILAFLNMIDNIPSENSFNRLIDVIPEHFRKLVIPYRDRCSSAAPTRPRASSAPDSPPFDFDSWRFEPKPMQGA